MFTLTARSIRRRLRSFAAEKRGAAAVEFALVAGPFFFLLFGIFQVAMLFFVSTVLENAAQQAARDIRTGEIQNGGGEAQFYSVACENMSLLLSCENLYYDVQTFDNFGAADPSSPIDEDEAYDPESFRFDAGAEEDIVVVRLFYEWTIPAPLLQGRALANLANGNRLLVATVAFRNEPFGDIEAES